MCNWELSFQEANATMQSGDINAIKKAFKELIEKFPKRHEPYYYMGAIDFENNDYKSSVYYMQKAIDIAPFYEGYNYLAKSYIFLRDRKNALKYIKQALIYNPYDEKLKEILYKLSPNDNFIDSTDISIDGFYQHSKDCPNIKYTKIFEKNTIKRKTPFYIEKQLNSYQKELLSKTINEYELTSYKEGFVVEIPDGLVFTKQSDQPHFITSDNKILLDMLDEKGPQLNITTLPDVIMPAENILVLSSCWGGNFYHWLTWCVPRLQMILNAGYKIEDFDKILINYVGFKFQKELIELLKIPKNKIIGTLENGAIFKAKKIVSASLPEFSCTPKIVVESLRNLLLKPEYLDQNKPKNIYLSREKSASRFIENEKELLIFLKKYNFETIYAEDLTLVEQIQYFANAEVILSQHGAGLANIAFCKPKTKIIEIYNDKMKSILDTSYWRISSDLNLNHYLMFGEPIGSGELSNMAVDISKLEEIFKLAKIQ